MLPHRRNHDLNAQAQVALTRILTRPQTGQRYWHAEYVPQDQQAEEEVDDDDDDDSVLGAQTVRLTHPSSHHVEVGPGTVPAPASPPASLMIPRENAKQVEPAMRQTEATAAEEAHSTSLQPVILLGQTVLVLGRQPKWNRDTLFTVHEVYTRDVRTMRKAAWTPQSLFPVVELRQGHDALVLPLSRVVPLPEFLQTRRYRRRVYGYRLDGSGRRKVRRYVGRYFCVWAEESWEEDEEDEGDGEREKTVGWRKKDRGDGDAKYGEIWVLVEWIDGERGEVEKVRARDLMISERGKWQRDMESRCRPEEESNGSEQDADEVAGRGSGSGDEVESQETEEEYRHVLREFGLE